MAWPHLFNGLLGLQLPWVILCQLSQGVTALSNTWSTGGSSIVQAGPAVRYKSTAFEHSMFVKCGVRQAMTPHAWHSDCGIML
jgi:hypothetical protein